MARTSLIIVLLLFFFGVASSLVQRFYPRQVSGNITMSDYENWIADRKSVEGKEAPIVPYRESDRAIDNNGWYTLRTLKDLKKGEPITSDSIEMVGMKRDTVPFGVVWTGGQFVGHKVSRDIPKDSLLRLGNLETFPEGSYYMGANRTMQAFHERGGRR
ncbi:MAG: SAF domain-containing protein [Cyanobacteriota/Melainabacteria group bacterium]